MRRLRWAVFVVFVAAGILTCRSVSRACAYPLRDAALGEGERWVRENADLLFLYDQDDVQTKAWRHTLEDGLKTCLSGANVNFQEVNVTSKDETPQAYNLKAWPARRPCVLVQLPKWGDSPEELCRWDATLTEADLRTLVDSPLRQKLRPILAEQLGAVLFRLCPDQEQNARARKLLHEAIAAFRTANSHALGLVELDPVKDERIEWSLLKQLAPLGPGPGVALVFGRGKVVQVDPAGSYWLSGTQLTAESLKELFSVPLQDCACVIVPNELGRDLVMPWPEELQAKCLSTAEAAEKVAQAGPPVPELAAAGTLTPQALSPSPVQQYRLVPMAVKHSAFENPVMIVGLAVGAMSVLTLVLAAIVYIRRRRERV